MGNTETTQQKYKDRNNNNNQQSHDSLFTWNSWNDLEKTGHKLPSGSLLDEWSEREKFESNKKKLVLDVQFQKLEYRLKYFTQMTGDISNGSPNQASDDKKIRVKSNRYEGTFKNGQLFGQGIYFYPTGSIYIGGIKDNGRNEKGVFYFSNGNIYSGQWCNNDQNGQGKFYFVNEEQKLFQYYSGNFKNSLYSGFGCYYYHNKYYIGYWNQDKCEGHGKIFSFEGKLLFCGIYKQDKLDQPLNEVDIKFPLNWRDYLPNFSQEQENYKQLIENKPIA